MKAAQITQYSKNIHITVNDIPIPETGDYDILIRIKAAAVNPVDILNLTGAVRLIQDYKMPLTLGNECAGIVEKVGRCVKKFKTGDRVYSRLPVSKIGAFAEYVAIHENAAAHMPDDLDFAVAAAIPLTGLTAYQAIVDFHTHGKLAKYLPFSVNYTNWLLQEAKGTGLDAICLTEHFNT